MFDYTDIYTCTLIILITFCHQNIPPFITARYCLQSFIYFSMLKRLHNPRSNPLSSCCIQNYMTCNEKPECARIRLTHKLIKIYNANVNRYCQWIEITLYWRCIKIKRKHTCNQGRRQGVCLGGGGGRGAKCLATAAASLESHFFSDFNFFPKIFYGVGVLPSWTWLTAELTSKKQKQKQTKITGEQSPPPPWRRACLQLPCMH